MNQAFYEFALKKIEEATPEELFEALTNAGIDVTIRQYPEEEHHDEETGQA